MPDPTYTVLIPVMNEIESLNKTISTILSNNDKFELIIILSPKTSLEARQNAFKFEANNIYCKVITQVKSGLGGAYQDGIDVSTGDYLIMIASDLETDPNLVRNLIDASSKNPKSIIATTRWRGIGAGFEGYSVTKYFLNWIFQKLISFLYKSKLSDYTFGFRLYPKEALKDKSWQEINFAFLLESILVPLIEGWDVIEIPHTWKPRVENESNNKIRYFIDYFKVAFRVRFQIE